MRTIRLTGAQRLTTADLKRAGALPRDVMESAQAIVDSVREGGDEVADYLGYGDAAGLLEVGSPFAESVAACLAQLLQELGVLPEAEAAQHAAEGLAPRRRGLFGRRREAV